MNRPRRGSDMDPDKRDRFVSEVRWMQKPLDEQAGI